MIRNTLPPLASNDLFGILSRVIVFVTLRSQYALYVFDYFFATPSIPLGHPLVPFLFCRYVHDVGATNDHFAADG